jgi:peptide/nickel transport system substrate-binding protein
MHSNTVLREAFEYEFSRLDPSGAHIDPPSVAIYETLMVKGPDWKPHPMLADSWKIESEGYEWKVRLNPGLRFHSGDPCDAARIAASFDFLRWHVEEDELWYWDPVEEVHSDGPETLVFKLKFPYSRLPSLLWGYHTAVHNESLRLKNPNDFGHTIADGTGPFRLVSWSPKRIYVERWTEYRGMKVSFLKNRGPALLEGIEWTAILDSKNRLEALEKGDVHCIHAPPFTELERLKRDPRFAVIEYPQQSNVYLALNWKRQDLGFDKPEIRKSLSLGIDRSVLVEDVLGGHGSITSGPLPPGDEFYDESIDTEKGNDALMAAEQLEKAGWRRGKDGIRQRNGVKLSFECLCLDDEVLQDISYAVKNQLSRLGIKIKLRFGKPFKGFYDACNDEPDSIISKWLWQDPLDAIIGFTSTRGQPAPNWQHSSIPELDAGYRRWLEAETKEDLRKAAFDVQRIAAEKLPYIPLLTPNDAWAFTKKLRGFEPFRASLYPLYQDATLDE